MDKGINNIVKQNKTKKTKTKNKTKKNNNNKATEKLDSCTF